MMFGSVPSEVLFLDSRHLERELGGYFSWSESGSNDNPQDWHAFLPAPNL